MRAIYLLTVPLLLLLTGCSGQGNRVIAADIEKWHRKEIIIPASLKYYVKGEQVDYDIDDCDFKLVTYVRSGSCSSCMMKLKEWRKALADFDTISTRDINLVMIVSSDTPDKIALIARQDDFNYPIAIDSPGVTDSINGFPEDSRFCSFLLNRYNRVVAIGNPATNPNIRELYIRRICGEKPTSLKKGKIPVEIVDRSSALGVIDPGSYIERELRIRSRADSILKIRSIVPDCDCVKASADKDELQPGQHIDIVLGLHADTIAGKFMKQITVFFDGYEDPMTIKIHGFINN